jgi:hypothetical protein
LAVALRGGTLRAQAEAAEVTPRTLYAWRSKPGPYRDELARLNEAVAANFEERAFALAGVATGHVASLMSEPTQKGAEVRGKMALGAMGVAARLRSRHATLDVAVADVRPMISFPPGLRAPWRRELMPINSNDGRTDGLNDVVDADVVDVKATVVEDEEFKESIKPNALKESEFQAEQKLALENKLADKQERIAVAKSKRTLAEQERAE